MSLFSTVALGGQPKKSDLKGLKAQIPKSAQALKVTYPLVGRGEEEEEEGGKSQGVMYCLKKSRGAHILPEYHMLVAGSQLKQEVRRGENMLEKMNENSLFTGVLGGEGGGGGGVGGGDGEGGELGGGEILRR